MQGQPLSNREVEAMAARHGLPSSGVERFPLVSTLAKFLRVVGFLLVVAGVIFFFKETAPWLSCNQAQQATPQQFFGGQTACPFPYMGVVGAVVVFVVGLGLVAFGELLGMFRSIEGNTYDMKVAQEADYKARLAQGS